MMNFIILTKTTSTDWDVDYAILNIMTINPTKILTYTLQSFFIDILESLSSIYGNSLQ